MMLNLPAPEKQGQEECKRRHLALAQRTAPAQTHLQSQGVHVLPILCRFDQSREIAVLKEKHSQTEPQAP